jgi:acid phosphatase
MNLNVEKFGIVALGDVGHQGTALESTTMAVQTKFASTASTGFLLGDNFYPIGVSSPTDAKFEHIFEGLIAQSLPGIPFHVVLGNHDWMGNVDAQIQFSSLNNQWIMPSRFYRRRFVTRSAITCVWFLDTEKVRRREAQDQLSWLESTLSTDSSCSWRIVVGHHPVFDSGFYSDDIRMLLDVLPIMERYGVDMYISGHEHQSRVYRKTDGRKPITFLIAGAASEAVSGYAKPHKNLVWANTEAVSFLHLSISGSEISYAFINSQGLNKPLHADSTSSNSAST